jgi:hypothetical protein
MKQNHTKKIEGLGESVRKRERERRKFKEKNTRGSE